MKEGETEEGRREEATEKLRGTERDRARVKDRVSKDGGWGGRGRKLPEFQIYFSSHLLGPAALGLHG